MHLLALGAFWQKIARTVSPLLKQVVMHLLALGAFWLSNNDTNTPATVKS